MLAAWLLLARTLGAASPLETSFWVWDRHEPLTQEEAGALAAGRVHTLYWERGELEKAGGHWQWRWKDGAMPETPGIHIVPVVRIVIRQPAGFGEDSIREIVTALSTPLWGSELQVDCDTPDRVLPEYASLLRTLHAAYPHLEATALAGWPRLAAWEGLKGCVDKWLPMFYDLETDPLLDQPGPPPLLEEAKVKTEFAIWQSCGVPWSAGLPGFARVTLYDRRGTSRGHLRAWNWDDLCFNRAIITMGATHLGTTVFRAVANGRIGDAPILAEEKVAARWPDRAILQAAAEAATSAGAREVTYFRWPDPDSAEGWSLSQLLDAAAKEHLVLRQPGPEHLVLLNDGPGDLAPRLAGASEQDRGYELELDAAAPIFREAIEGDFWRVTGSAGAAPVPVPLASRLTFWFSHLPAGKSLRTGLLQLAPGATFRQVRYRILNTSEPGAWESIAPMR